MPHAQILNIATEQWVYSNYFYCFKDGCYEPILVAEKQSLVTTNTCGNGRRWYTYTNYTAVTHKSLKSNIPYTVEPLYNGHLWGPTFRPL